MHIVLEIIQAFCYLFYCYVEAVIRCFLSETKEDFTNKLVLVTGAGHGIGRELALQFSALGARLVLWDINKENNDSVAAEIRERGGTAMAYLCDVGKADQIKQVADQVKREFGDPHVLVNNAGILNGGSFLKLKDEDIKRTMDVNIMSYIWTCRQFLPSMIDLNEGHIINICSMSAKRGLAYLTDYSASKYAVDGFTEALKDELRREGYTGIHFTTVFPMFVNTGLAKHIIDRLGRWLSAKEVATAVIDGAQKKRHYVYIPSSCEILVRIGMLFPIKFFDEPLNLLYRGIHPQYGEHADE